MLLGRSGWPGWLFESSTVYQHVGSGGRQWADQPGFNSHPIVDQRGRSGHADGDRRRSPAESISVHYRGGDCRVAGERAVGGWRAFDHRQRVGSSGLDQWSGGPRRHGASLV